MSFQLVPKSVTLKDLERRMAVTLRYFTEFDKPASQHISAAADKEDSSRSLSHLLMSFLSYLSHLSCV